MDDMKNLMRSVRLALTAAELRADGKPLPEKHIPAINEAESAIAKSKGVDVLAAVATMRRSGLNLTIDFSLPSRETDELKPNNRFGRRA